MNNNVVFNCLVGGGVVALLSNIETGIFVFVANAVIASIFDF